jgi:hypothetical protein
MEFETRAGPSQARVPELTALEERKRDGGTFKRAASANVSKVVKAAKRHVYSDHERKKQVEYTQRQREKKKNEEESD